MTGLRGLLLVTLLLVAGKTLAAQTRPLLWRVDGYGRHGWLFGSLHFGAASFYPLPATVRRAFAEADTLAVEIDLLAQDPLEAAQQLRQAGFYAAPDQDLQHSLSAAGWRRLAQAARRLDVPLAYLQHQRPWLAALTLSDRLFQQAGFSGEQGIDLHFLRQASERGMPVVELESLQQQLDLLARLPRAEQLALLNQTLADAGDGEGYVDQVVDAWRHGDIAALDRLLNPPPDPVSQRLYKALLSQRNGRMAAAIARLLAAGKRPFVVVGAGHLVAGDSVAEQLSQRGYRVVRR